MDDAFASNKYDLKYEVLPREKTVFRISREKKKEKCLHEITVSRFHFVFITGSNTTEIIYWVGYVSDWQSVDSTEETAIMPIKSSLWIFSVLPK